MKGRNDIPLPVIIDGEIHQNICLYELENQDGLVCVSLSFVMSANLLRRDLNNTYAHECRTEGEIGIFVSEHGGVRTDADNERLGEELGWNDEIQPDGKPGRVSRNSKHLVKHGGIAGDLKAKFKISGRILDHKTTQRHADKYFDWTKLYSSHVHCDNRDGGKKLIEKGYMT